MPPPHVNTTSHSSDTDPSPGLRAVLSTGHAADRADGGRPRTGTPEGITRSGKITLAVTVTLAALILLPQVVWAPLFGDPGEVQLTAAVGGIGHPPGQAGIISLFRLFCLIVPAPPHLTVSAVNALFCLTAVAVLNWAMIRAGGEPLAVVLVALFYLTDDQFWHASVLPETYGACFFLLAVAVFCWFSSLQRGGGWRFWTSVASFTFLGANRAPTIMLALPFVLTAMTSDRARAFLSRNRKRVVAGVIALGITSIAVVLGSLWVRDVPGCPYNYLDQSWPSQGGFPNSNTSWENKAKRLWWLVSARQYDYMFHPTAHTVAGQWVWLKTEFGARYWPVALIVLAVALFGATRLWRRDRTLAVFAFSMIPAALLPILLIRVVSNTTLLPNLLWPYALLFCVGLSDIIRWRRAPLWRGFVTALVVGVALFFRGGDLLPDKSEFDARSFIAEVNLQSLPPDATLLAFDVLPLIYVQQTQNIRPDVKILLYHGRLNADFVAQTPGRVFTTLRYASELPGLDCLGSGAVCELRVRPQHRQAPPLTRDCGETRNPT